MRQLTVALVFVAATGCQPRATIKPRWTVYADDARLDAADANGQPWCDGLRVRATAWLARGKHIATPAATGLTPSWHAPLFAATAHAFSRGLFLDVLGQCGTKPPFSLGALSVKVTPTMLAQGGVALDGFGSVAALRLHFAAPGGSSALPPSYGDYPAGDVGVGPVAVYVPPLSCDSGGDPYDGCGAWPSDADEPDPNSDPGTYYDPGANDPNAYDPNDPNAPDPNATDPNATDPGIPDPSAPDPGVGDPGAGDPGSGGDDSGTEIRRRKQHTPAHRTTMLKKQI